MDSKLSDIYFNTVLLKESTDENSSIVKHDETDMSNTEEQTEVKIGKNILELIRVCETTPDESYIGTLKKIKAEAKKLLSMHVKQ
jgi:hypothetical protein